MQRKFNIGDTAYLKKEINVHGINPFKLYEGAAVKIIGINTTRSNAVYLYSIRVTNPRNGRTSELENFILEEDLYSEKERSIKIERDAHYQKLFRKLEQRRKELKF